VVTNPKRKKRREKKIILFFKFFMVDSFLMVGVMGRAAFLFADFSITRIFI